MKTRTALAVCTLVASSLVVGGCASMQNPEYEKTRKGAGYGAAAGAVIGLIAKGNKLENAMIGAAIGGLAGGAIGNYQDRQEAKLRQAMAGTGVEVVRVADNITLNMPGNITFQTDSAQLSPSFNTVLDKVASTLVEFDQTIVEVAGHTDSTGPDAYNQSLSERRAASVASHLTGKGVNPKRLITVGAGETKPVADNSTPEGRQLNRRVELTIVPVEKKG